MENIFHYGTGKFGYVTTFKNGQIAYSWFTSKERRDSSLKEAKSKMTNKKSIKPTSR